MRALESSPVHCLKLRPCGKHRKPENNGATAILKQSEYNAQELVENPYLRSIISIIALACRRLWTWKR